MSTTSMEVRNEEIAATRGVPARSLNINFALYTEGDEAFKRELGTVLIDNIRELKASLSDAVQRRDAEMFQKAHHKSKVTIAMLEDPEFDQLIGQLQADIAGGGETASHVQQFGYICDLIAASLAREISAGNGAPQG